MNIKKIKDLALVVEAEASREGCENGLMIVNESQLWDLLQAIKKVKDYEADLLTAQTLLSQTIHYAERTDKFVSEVANLKMWGFDSNDGTRYEECSEPNDGAEDSHTCLMTLIEDARKLVSKPSQAGESQAQGRLKPAMPEDNQLREKKLSSMEIFAGHLAVDGEVINVEFQAPADASTAEKDAAFMASLAQKVEVNYLSVGRTPVPAAN